MRYAPQTLHLKCRLLICSSILLCSQLTYADWVSVGDIEGIEDKHYVDPARLNQNAKPYPSIWVLVDQKKPSTFQGMKFKSTVRLMECDCRSNKVRQSVIYLYSENMGTGKIIKTISSADEFRAPPPSSPPELYMLLACNKSLPR